MAKIRSKSKKSLKVEVQPKPELYRPPGSGYGVSSRRQGFVSQAVFREEYRERLRNFMNSPSYKNNPNFKRVAQEIGGGVGPIPSMGTLGGGGIPMSGPMSATGKVVTTAPIFYDIRYFTPDKFYFPSSELEQNDVWRMVYKRDPVVGAGIDLYADFAFSEFDLLGIEDKYIRETYESMCQSLNLQSKLPDMSREFLIEGKVIPHLIFNDTLGYWRRMFIHNPDFIRVTPIPFMDEEPLIDMRIPVELKNYIASPDYRIQQMISKLPHSLASAMLSSSFIPLDNINVSYIPRKALGSDWKGTSILERLYRMLMFEDFLMNAALAVAQRNAVPLKLFKLGDASANWYPSEEDAMAFSELLAIAEADPVSAIIMHSGIDVDYVGVSDRFWNVAHEWDFITETKLIGLGVGKGFLTGESSFAAAVSQLQTFVQKVAGLRTKLEHEWLLPKVFKTVAQINQFYKRSDAELAHRIRVDVEDRDLIIPKLKWHRSLEPTQETALLSIWQELKEKGLVSDRTLAAGSGVNLDVERTNIKEEKEYNRKMEEEDRVAEENPNPIEMRQSLNNTGNKFHVVSEVLHSAVFSKEGTIDDINYTKFEPVISFLKGTDVAEFKGIDRKDMHQVFRHLAEQGWNEIETKALVKVINAEGLIKTREEVVGDMLQIADSHIERYGKDKAAFEHKLKQALGANRADYASGAIN